MNRIEKIKEIQARAGSLSDHVVYFVLVLVWYLAHNVYGSLSLSGGGLQTLLYFGFTIFIGPMFWAGLFGGIHQRQLSPGASNTGRFFTGIRTHYWRMMAAMLLAKVTLITASIIIFGAEQPDLTEKTLPLALVHIPYSAITLFWSTALVVERKLFRSLIHAVKILLVNPYAAAIGIVWAAASFADWTLFELPGNQISLATNIVRAGLLAGIRVIAIAYALAVYSMTWGQVDDDPPQGTSVPAPASTSSGDRLLKAGFGFSLVAFIPVLHLVALVLGVLSLRRKKRLTLKSAIACCVGGFFTIFYLLIIAGWIATGPSPPDAPGYGFLVEAKADLESQVILLEQGAVEEVQQQLEQNTTPSSDRHWAVDCVSALAKYRAYDLDGALIDFRMGGEKQPDRGEFYFHYGIALVEDGQAEMAAEQLQTALMHDPRLEAAGQRLALIKAAYDPPVILSQLLWVITLLISFALHEYGHAYVAWKLGDDTAKDQGRLTLNPIPHLDLFGSIILPGILLWQQAGVVFGWARPVPINPENFRNPKKDHMRVSFAGPAVNLIVAMICVVILGFLMLFVRLVWPETLSLNLAAPSSAISMVGPPIARTFVFIVMFFRQMFYTSVILGCFNLIPVAPLDGSWILSGLLPPRLSALYEKTRKFGFVVFLLLVVTPVLDYLLTVPITVAMVGLEVLVSAMGFG